MTTEQAIAKSINHNEIVTIRAESQAEYDACCAELRAYVTSEGDIHEFWGCDGSDDWRVHVRLSA